MGRLLATDVEALESNARIRVTVRLSEAIAHLPEVRAVIQVRQAANQVRGVAMKHPAGPFAAFEAQGSRKIQEMEDSMLVHSAFHHLQE
jgi:hypothetical protein